MIRIASTTLVALIGLGCVSYRGGARPIDPASLTTEAGWIVAGPTPELPQHGSKDCGAASLAMIAGRWHVNLSVDKVVAALPAQTARGTRLGDLRDVARARGLTAYAIVGDRDTLVHELRAGRPVVIGLILPYGRGRVLRHYEVIVAVHLGDDRFVTIDPAHGWRARSFADLDAEWSPAGRATLVVLGPDAADEVIASWYTRHEPPAVPWNMVKRCAAAPTIGHLRGRPWSRHCVCVLGPLNPGAERNGTMKKETKRHSDKRDGKQTVALTSGDLKMVVGGGISTSPSPRG